MGSWFFVTTMEVSIEEIPQQAILQVVFFRNGQIVVQFINKWLTSWDFKIHDIIVGNAFDVFC